jgi:hypothetical protein
MLDPVGTVVELWDIKGAFPTSITYGTLTYDEASPVEISVEIRPDNCILQF